MRISISSAKQMWEDTDSVTFTELLVFTDRVEIQKDWIRSLSFEEQKNLWLAMIRSSGRTPSDLYIWIFRKI